MTRVRRSVLALAVLGVLGVVAAGIWLVAAPGKQDAAPVAAPAPRPTDSSWPGLAAGPSVAASVPPAADTPAVPSSPDAPAGGPAEPVAEPFVQNYAGQPGVKPLKPLPSPTKKHYVRPNVDGCDHNYGEVTQCVPWTFPPGTTDKCAWLAEHGFKKLKVAAADRQKLDTDGNKIACDN
ncbi:hypothetical protein AB0C12_01615 [Actinoplanes sp. NPDC048967]|uniref:hypothetical protein n=1 Tax=Actinoplanes sp. NPDC048967 TaxID=3155269 RepID=UPI0033E9581E